MESLQLLIKPASGSCNLQCEYCFYQDEMKYISKKQNTYMSYDTLESIIKKSFAYAKGSCSFMFQGGEPTLVGLSFYQEVIRLQKIYNRNNIKVMNSLQTNGSLLTKEWVAFFARYNFLIGVSLDGVKASHDIYRKDKQSNGTWLTVIQAIDLLKEYQVAFHVLTVVHKQTVSRVRKIYEFYKKNKWTNLQFIPCLPPFENNKKSVEYTLTPSEYGAFLNELFQLWYMDYQKGQQPYIRMFENYIGILLGFPPEACEQNGFCSLQYVVEADGRVYPCDFYVLDSYCIGNLLEDELVQIQETSKALQFLKDSMQNYKECNVCPYATLCKGGCRRHREIQSMGKISENYWCSSYKYFFEKNLETMLQIARRL